MDACTKCKKPCGPLELRAAPGSKSADALCPACYAAWAEFQLEAFVEEVHAVHASAHESGQDDEEARADEQLRSCRWDACKRAGRLAGMRVLA